MFTEGLPYSFVKKHDLCSEGNLNDVCRGRAAWFCPCRASVVPSLPATPLQADSGRSEGLEHYVDMG